MGGGVSEWLHIQGCFVGKFVSKKMTAKERA